MRAARRCNTAPLALDRERAYYSAGMQSAPLAAVTAPDGRARQAPADRPVETSLPRRLRLTGASQSGPWLAIALLAGAYAVRLREIQAKGLWWDEGLTVFFANLGITEYLDLRWMDIHPPLYRLLMLGGVAIGGPSDFDVRYWSAMLSLIAVALTYQLGRRLGGRTTGLLAAILIGLSPFVLYHAQEAKMYALLLTLTAAYLVAAERLISGNHGRWWWLLAVGSATLALWSHYYSTTTLLAVSLVYLVRWLQHDQRVPTFRAWLLRHLVAVVLFLPWLVFDGGRIPADADRTIGSATLNSVAFAGEIWTTLAAGYPLVGTWLGIALATLFGGLALLALADHVTLPGRRLLLGFTIFLPILIGVAISIRFPYNAPRFFIVCAPPFAVAVALGCGWLVRVRPVAGLAIAGASIALAGLTCTAVYAQPSLSDDYRPLIGALVERYRPGDLALCGYPWQVGYVRAYAPGVVGRIFPIPERFETLADRSTRLWVLYFMTPEGEDDFIRTRLEAAGMRRTLDETSGESRVALFERPS